MNEPLQNRLGDALRRLREDSSSQAAPNALEGTMLDAFRAHHAARAKRRHWTWVPVAIAASLALAVASLISEPVKVEAPSVPVAVAPPAASVEMNSEPVTTPVSVEKRKAPAKRRVKPPARPPARPLSLATARPAREPQQEFVEIPYAPPFAPYDEGHVVRVNMAGSSARRMGIPVVMDRVQADLVVGNDGLPRAIRVVSNSGAQYR
jgi:hypothetical protein